MELRMKTLIFWGFTEKLDFQGGGAHEKPIQRGGGFPKKGAWTVCQFKGAWQERAGSVFEGGLIPPMHTMSEWLQAKCFKVSHSFDF